MVTDAIAVLQEHEKVEAAGVDTALAEYKKLTDKPASEAPLSRSRVPRGPSAPRAPRPAASSPGAARRRRSDPDVAAALEDKRQQIRSLEAGRQRELETLRAQLAQAQLTLTPQHPTVIALQQKVDTLSAPDPQLEQLTRRGARAHGSNRAAAAGAPGPRAARVRPRSPASARYPVGAAGHPRSTARPPATPGRTPRPSSLARSSREPFAAYQEAVARIDGGEHGARGRPHGLQVPLHGGHPCRGTPQPKKPIAHDSGRGVGDRGRAAGAAAGGGSGPTGRVASSRSGRCSAA